MITLAGAGPGNIKLLTQETIEAITNAEQVIAFPRIAEDIKPLCKRVIQVKTVQEINRYAAAEKDDVLVLASGDANFFGIAEYLRRNKIKIKKILCGISSVQYFAAKLNISQQNIKTFSFHGRDMNYDELKNETRFFLLTDKKNNPLAVSTGLKEIGFSGKIYIGYNLSYDDEIIEIHNIGDDFKIKSDLNAVFIENEKY